MSEIRVHRHAALVPVSAEALADTEGMRAACDRFMNATPEQHEQWAREAADRRAAERAAATPVELTLDTLIDALDWTREYAEHVVQRYCDCRDGSDGWERCEHSGDLGLEP